MHPIQGISVIKDACTIALISAMARRQPRARYVSAWYAHNLLQMEGESFTFEHIKRCFSTMQDHSIGGCLKDEENYVGFQWEIAPCVVYEFLMNGPVSEWPVHTYPITPRVVDELTAWPIPLHVHTLHLNENKTMRLELPESLTLEDVERIGYFLQAMVGDAELEGRVWPFSNPKRLSRRLAKEEDDELDDEADHELDIGKEFDDEFDDLDDDEVDDTDETDDIDDVEEPKAPVDKNKFSF